VNTAARTAVVVGTASAVSGKVASNQAAKAQPAEAAPVPAPPPSDGVPGGGSGSPSAGPAALSDDAYEQLKKLGELREAGILTDEEFQAKKAQILAV